MDLFKWLIDIEKIYEDLINNAKKESFTEIQEFKKQKEKDLEMLLKKKQEVVDSELSDLSKEIADSNIIFKKGLDDAIKTVENEYHKNKDKIVKLIIEELGFNF